MKHVTDRIQLWLSGELSAAESVQVEAHLEACPECARSAQQTRQLWETLGSLADQKTGTRTSVWPGVRDRTFGRQEAGSWFLGGGRLVQSSLATAALAAGLFLGILLPGGGSDQVGGEAEALPVSEDQLDSYWLDDSSWGEGVSAFETAWIEAGLVAETDGSIEGDE